LRDRQPLIGHRRRVACRMSSGRQRPEHPGYSRRRSRDWSESSCGSPCGGCDLPAVCPGCAKADQAGPR
jgi:hypothetical protein